MKSYLCTCFLSILFISISLSQDTISDSSINQWNHELNIGYPIYNFVYNGYPGTQDIITGYFISYNPLYKLNEKFYIEGQLGYEFILKSRNTNPAFFQAGDIKFILVQAGVRWYFNAEPSNFRTYVKLLPAYVYREERTYFRTLDTIIDGTSYVWLSGGLFFDIKNRYNFGVSVNASTSIVIRAGFKL